MNARIRVAIIDDDAATRGSLVRLVKSAGIAADAFPSAGEFLESATRAETDCVVTDMKMPKMDGLTLQEALAQTAPHLSVVFVTGHGDVAKGVRAMKRGAVDFLEKPVDENDLLTAIRRAVERSRTARASHLKLAELQARYVRLTPRERQVFQLIVSGLLNKQAGAELGTAEKTIKVQRAAVMSKMRASSFAELVRMADVLNLPRPEAGDSTDRAAFDSGSWTSSSTGVRR